MHCRARRAHVPRPGTRLSSLAALASLAACGGADDSWGPVTSAPALQRVTHVWAFSERDAWFLDGGPTIHRTDGERWSTLATPASGGLGCLFALSPTEVWLCAGSEVLRYDGASFSSMDVTGPTGLSGLSGLWAASPTDVWAVGEDALVAHYDGTRWTGTSGGPSFATSIWGSGPHDVYAMGTFELVHYDGAQWSPIDLPGSGAGDGQVWGTSASNVWASSGSSSLFHFDGSTWDLVESGDFYGDLSALWGSAPDDLWAAGSAGTIAHFDGTSWREVTHQPMGAPYLRQFVAVHGSSSRDVWAVGHQLGEGGSTGLIYHLGR